MGEVYRARDTRLSRTVAIKIIKSSFSELLEREAHAISALNHPNICTLYQSDQPSYLTLVLSPALLFFRSGSTLVEHESRASREPLTRSPLSEIKLRDYLHAALTSGR
jgi:serine/threonine protein kinase